MACLLRGLSPHVASGSRIVSPDVGAANACKRSAMRGPNSLPAVSPLWKSISSLRGLAMCLVVANHAIRASSGAFIAAYPSVQPGVSPAAFLMILLLRSLTPACLVAFFFASGFTAFRFFTDAKSSRVAAAQITRKYLMWSALMLAFQLLQGREIGLRDAAKALMLGTTQPAYWFLVVIGVLVVSTPIWVRLVRTRARWSFASATALQVASCAFFYLAVRGGDPLSPWELFIVRPVQFLPSFLAGMWVSRNADRVAVLLHRYRRLLISLSGVAAVTTVAEAYVLWETAGFTLQGPQPMFATERATLIAFALVAISTVIGTEIQNPRLANWLKGVGNSSLGIMLLMDFCIGIVIAGLWHLPPLVSDAAATALRQHRLAPGIAEYALWLTPGLFVAGLWGPLRIMEWVRRLAGTRVRYLW